MDNKKRSGNLWRRLLILFGVCMVILTLLSSTIQNAMLPKVLTSTISDDQLQSTIDGKGKLQPVNQTDITNPNGLPIHRIHVKEGDVIARGDILVEYDTKDLNRQRLDAQDAIKQKKLHGEKLKQDFINATKESDELLIRDAQRNLQSYGIELAMEERKYQSLLEEIEKKRYSKAPYAGLISEVKGNAEDVPSAGQPIATLVKKSDGYQFTFAVNEDQTSWLEENETVDINIRDGGKSARVKGLIESIEIGNSSDSQGSGADGLMAQDPQEDNKKNDGGTSTGPTYQITVQVKENPKHFKLKLGLEASVTIMHTSDQKGYVISRDWIKQDKDGQYVLVVEEKLGAFGNDYTVKKAYVREIETSEDQALVSGLTPKDQIITESAEPVEDGDRVRIH